MKSLVICSTQIAGNSFLKFLKYVEVTFYTFAFCDVKVNLDWFM